MSIMRRFYKRYNLKNIYLGGKNTILLVSINSKFSYGTSKTKYTTSNPNLNKYYCLIALLKMIFKGNKSCCVCRDFLTLLIEFVIPNLGQIFFIPLKDILLSKHLDLLKPNSKGKGF